MAGLLLYCRAGYEKDTAAEVEHKTTEMEIYGYSRFQPGTGYVVFECYQPQDAETLGKKLILAELVFARQMFVCTQTLEIEDPRDRISPILDALEHFPLAGDVCVDYPDTDQGRELATFCRKFTVPLRQALRKADKLTPKPQQNRPVVHCLFVSSTKLLLGYGFSFNRSEQPLGILRLKFPNAAPSRSTLKLEEAFRLLAPELEDIIRGKHAVDLGASPGGWTYQLVQRGMFVQAVDNGPMDPALMDTGQVKHFAEDGFKFSPHRAKITLLVCDMIEKPDRVAALMAKWLANSMAEMAIFNLKLPMKQRYQGVNHCIGLIEDALRQQGLKHLISAKHLYHDRDEVTCYVRPPNISA